MSLAQKGSNFISKVRKLYAPDHHEHIEPGAYFRSTQTRNRPTPVVVAPNRRLRNRDSVVTPKKVGHHVKVYKGKVTILCNLLLV